ncbi:MAG: hypothetical protein EOP51_03360 [Sphingobacteriales bacterium]|nr:MAG: hypothetical protein EOP51_03360 [Sphingobacteriales bacterium]
MEKLLSLFTTESQQVIYYHNETSDRLVNRLTGIADRYMMQYKCQMEDNRHIGSLETKVSEFYNQLINIQTYLMHSWNEI